MPQVLPRPQGHVPVCMYANTRARTHARTRRREREKEREGERDRQRERKRKRKRGRERLREAMVLPHARVRPCVCARSSIYI